MDVTYYVTAAADSGVPYGKNLWYLAAFLSDRPDGSGGNRHGYTGNVLAPKQAKTPISPGREVAIPDIRFDFPASGKSSLKCRFFINLSLLHLTPSDKIFRWRQAEV